GAAAEVSSGLLLAETDSPFLTPQVRRGEDNAPANVRHVVETLAEVRGEEAGVVARTTSENARRAFGLPA
ncbi:MAG TPA: TatD family hydrolase, partial [Actinomycetota bacterium]|nr:TatD family hydrolase [Actinomycetota bacterium]